MPFTCWLVLLVVLVGTTTQVDGFSAVATSNVDTKTIANELSATHIQTVNDWVASALGDNQDDAKQNRYAGARALADSLQQRSSSGLSTAEESSSLDDTGRHLTSTNSAGREISATFPRRGVRDSDASVTSIPQQHELVYGELSIPVLATILDAVGVQPGDRFMDIGAGDGALVLGACMLYPQHVVKSRGVELVPGLVERSKQHARNLRDVLVNRESPFSSRNANANLLDRVDFALGNVYEPDSDLEDALSDTTLSVCFATTWSHVNNQQDGKEKTSLGGRRLSKLSPALTRLPMGARVVIVDGRLDEKDGFRWEGDLKIYCPDTAPYSVASLFVRC